MAFFTRVLAPLGYGVSMQFDDFVGFGTKGKPTFWVKPGAVPTTPMHLALVAPSREAVDAFYAEALAAGAQDNGPPGVRVDYHPNYYAAFVTDVDGHNLEAVCHLPPTAVRPKARPVRRASAPKKRRARQRH